MHIIFRKRKKVAYRKKNHAWHCLSVHCTFVGRERREKTEAALPTVTSLNPKPPRSSASTSFLSSSP